MWQVDIQKGVQFKVSRGLRRTVYSHDSTEAWLDVIGNASKSWQSCFKENQLFRLYYHHGECFCLVKGEEQARLNMNCGFVPESGLWSSFDLSWTTPVFVPPHIALWIGIFANGSMWRRLVPGPKTPNSSFQRCVEEVINDSHQSPCSSRDESGFAPGWPERLFCVYCAYGCITAHAAHSVVGWLG